LLEDFKKYNKSLKQFKAEEEIIIKKQFKKIRNLITINRIRYRKINNKEYILQTPEYS
jgi:hypothetical protein